MGRHSGCFQEWDNRKFGPTIGDLSESEGPRQRRCGLGHWPGVCRRHVEKWHADCWHKLFDLRFRKERGALVDGLTPWTTNATIGCHSIVALPRVCWWSRPPRSRYVGRP